MAFFGSSWKDDIEGDEKPMVGHNWVDKSEDIFPIPEPDVKQLLDRLDNKERREIFKFYCFNCGSKISDCKCSEKQKNY